jgi:hypothetical protein
VFTNTPLVARPHDFFADNEYMLGDSAFENFWFMVAAYRKPRGTILCHEHEVFNDAIAHGPRVLSEQTIGILKG